MRTVYEGEIAYDALTRSGVGIAFEDLEEDYEQKNTNRLNRSLPIALIGVFRMDSVVGDQTMRQTARKLLADMEKALMADPTRGGYARDTILDKPDIQSGGDVSPYVLVMLGIHIEYQTSLTNPASH